MGKKYINKKTIIKLNNYKSFKILTSFWHFIFKHQYCNLSFS